VLGPLLGKLHVSPASTEDKIREVYADVSSAVDDKLIADATGRNALFKIHVSLGKIVNTLDKSSKGRKSSPIVEDKTVIEDEASDHTVAESTDKVKAEPEEDDEATSKCFYFGDKTVTNSGSYAQRSRRDQRLSA